MGGILVESRNRLLELDAQDISNAAVVLLNLGIDDT
jgi:hypothetical protein